jgi:hypothetical protein
MALTELASLSYVTTHTLPAFEAKEIGNAVKR